MIWENAKYENRVCWKFWKQRLLNTLYFHEMVYYMYVLFSASCIILFIHTNIYHTNYINLQTPFQTCLAYSPCTNIVFSSTARFATGVATVQENVQIIYAPLTLESNPIGATCAVCKSVKENKISLVYWNNWLTMY